MWKVTHIHIYRYIYFHCACTDTHTHSYTHAHAARKDSASCHFSPKRCKWASVACLLPSATALISCPASCILASCILASCDCHWCSHSFLSGQPNANAIKGGGAPLATQWQVKALKSTLDAISHDVRSVAWWQVVWQLWKVPVVAYIFLV